MAKLQVNPSKIEVVKKTLSVAAPTGGTMGGATKDTQGTRGPISDEGTQMKMGGELKGPSIQSTRIPKVEDETEDVVRIGKTLFKKDDVVAMLPQLKKIFSKEAEGDNRYVFDDVQNIISTLSGKPTKSSYTIDKDKYNKINVTRNLYDVGESGYANKIIDYLKKAGLGM
jgi:hypothetical protein